MPSRAREENQPFLYEEGGQDLDSVESHDHAQTRRSYGSEKGKIPRCQLALALLISLSIAVALVVGITLVATKDERDAQKKGYRNAAVASDATQCSKIGKDILLQGGNAVDASIATLLCNGLTDPQSMGIGGGFFMTIYNRTTGIATVIDARETAPEKATVDMFAGNPTASAVGKLSIAVPSEIKGFWMAHQKYGSLPWKDLFQPAIKMARDGFPVPIGLHKAILDDTDLLSTEPSLKVVFINKKTGKLFKEGEIMTRPQLAKTLKVIAEEGASAFYNGSLTDSILDDLHEIGSIITRRDLLNYTVIEKEPIEITLSGGLRLISPPPPASGPVLSFILNILDGYKFTPEDIGTDKATTLTYHRVVEAFKFAYAKRTDLGDEDFVNVSELVRNLTSREYADSIRKLITDDRTHDYMYYGPTFYSRNTTGTTHLSVLDQFGNGVSVTSTINARFGSQRRGIKTGIIFNDEMDDFSSPNVTNEWGVPPSEANFIVPGKRPLSSMCPSVFVNTDNSVNMVLGAAGGTKITTATAWVAAKILWLGESVKQAIDAPRMHHQLLPPWIQYESGFRKNIINGLHKLGHNLTEFKPGSSIVQGIDVKNRIIYAASDYRKGGTPDGF